MQAHHTQSSIDVTSTGATTVNESLSGAVNPAPAPACSELFISEYIEGSANNKYLEIYNPTASPVDLGAGNYSLRIYTNGSSTPSDYPITGVIGAYSTMVFKNSAATI
ncbi:MAG: lamin tail domain-containing protein [Bacteroidia bacterium]